MNKNKKKSIKIREFGRRVKKRNIEQMQFIENDHKVVYYSNYINNHIKCEWSSYPSVKTETARVDQKTSPKDKLSTEKVILNVKTKIG